MTMLEPRRSCARCHRPLVAWVPEGSAVDDGRTGATPATVTRVAVPGACFCDRITLLPTRTRILLLQHPRERRMGIGTARLAHLALPGSELRVGVDFAQDEVVRAAAFGEAPAYLLFPGASAQPVEQLPRDRAITLVVLDGTWSQARKLLAQNPALAGLPRVAFTPRRPSGYLIRKQPADFCVSTIEALAEVLQAIEPAAGEVGGFDGERLLDPFRAMVERQVWFETAVRARRHLRPVRTRDPRRSRLADRLVGLGARLVCVQGEANAWSRRDPQRQEPETIHWVAHRPATGETYQALVLPRRPLAPATTKHVELTEAQIGGGVDHQRWHEQWRAFARPDDVLCTWGDFYRGLAVADGLPLAADTIDLRIEVTSMLRRRVGTIEDCLASLGAEPAPLGLPGRGGRRLAGLVGVLENLRAQTADDAAVIRR
jgi:DTW domain-containing protein